MESTMKAIEVTGTVDEQGHLHLDEPLTLAGSSRVHVILLFDGSDMEEREWLSNAANNPAFEFLHDPAEDIYTITDGKQYHG